MSDSMFDLEFIFKQFFLNGVEIKVQDKERFIPRFWNKSVFVCEIHVLWIFYRDARFRTSTLTVTAP